jgi:type VI secretion system protein ImpK
VRDEIDRSVIVVPGAELFDAGGASLQPGGTALLRDVAAALARTPGRIRIIGHTDSVAVRSARYPSDWDLSVDRAHAVEDALRELGIDGSRMSYDGRAGTEPSGTDGQVGSRGDGRIEIVLLAGR